MKVDVSIFRKEIEVADDSAVAQLYNFYKQHPNYEEWKDCPDSLHDRAINEIEKVMGLPFGEEGKETITGVYDSESGDGILEY